MKQTIWLRPKGQITLPAELRDAARIREGDPLEAELTEEGILLRPKKVIDADQVWFWEEQWQRGEREASREIAAEKTVRYDSAEEFVRALKKPPRAAPKRRRRDADV